MTSQGVIDKARVNSSPRSCWTRKTAMLMRDQAIRNDRDDPRSLQVAEGEDHGWSSSSKVFDGEWPDQIDRAPLAERAGRGPRRRGAGPIG